MAQARIEETRSSVVRYLRVAGGASALALCIRERDEGDDGFQQALITVKTLFSRLLYRKMLGYVLSPRDHDNYRHPTWRYVRDFWLMDGWQQEIVVSVPGIQQEDTNELISYLIPIMRREMLRTVGGRTRDIGPVQVPEVSSSSYGNGDEYE